MTRSHRQVAPPETRTKIVSALARVKGYSTVPAELCCYGVTQAEILIKNSRYVLPDLGTLKWQVKRDVLSESYGANRL